MRNSPKIVAVGLVLGLLMLAASSPAAEKTVIVSSAGGNQGAAAVRSYALPYGNWKIPAEVDANDATERLLLLAPGGPLVIELEMTIDGQPFRTHREEMIREMLRQSDTDGDGKRTWAEALANGRFALGRFATTAQIEATRQRYIKQYDKNSDGQVDPGECRLLVAQLFSGPAFMVAPNSYASRLSTGPVVQKLLDTNGDGALDADEIAKATGRLSSRDRDADEIVDTAELSGAPAGQYGAYNLLRGKGNNYRSSVSPAPALLLQLGPLAESQSLFSALQQQYGSGEPLTAERMPARKELLPRLDRNDNGQLDADEVLELNNVEPHLKLRVHLGQSGKLPAGLTVDGISSQLGQADKVVQTAGEVTTIDLRRVQLQLSAASAAAQTANYDAAVKAQFTRFDKDKNGYLEKKELAEVAAYAANQFAIWDVNNDGKVYPDEMKQAYVRSQAPLWNRISVTANLESNSLLNVIDNNGDGALGLRELREAGRRLKSLDKNQNGRVDAEEIPQTIRLVVARGQTGYAGFARTGRVLYTGVSAGRPANANPRGPAWFLRMDRNGDGDLSPREFIGSREQFDRLDADHDGLIDADEAAAAEKK